MTSVFWQPAKPGDTPGQLLPGEGDTPFTPEDIQWLAKQDELIHDGHGYPDMCWVKVEKVY